jgi:hypothetical protein
MAGNSEAVVRTPRHHREWTWYLRAALLGSEHYGWDTNPLSARSLTADPERGFACRADRFRDCLELRVRRSGEFDANYANQEQAFHPCEMSRLLQVGVLCVANDRGHCRRHIRAASPGKVPRKGVAPIPLGRLVMRLGKKRRMSIMRRQHINHRFRE